MKIQDKMKRDWDRRAEADPYYWVAATQEADLESYHASASKDCDVFLTGLEGLGTELADGSLLDLGCGIGRMTALLGSHFKSVVGVDVSSQMIEQARALHGDQDNVSFLVNSGADLSELEDQSFRVICSYSVLPHLPPDIVEAYFKEMGRILEFDGVVRYQFWVGPSHHPEDHDTLGIHVYTETELDVLHRKAGLVEVSREEIDYFDPVLKLKPVWVNARRKSEVEPEQLMQVEREVDEELGEHERQLEYDLMLHLAFRYVEQERREDAEQILERATQLDPQRGEAYLHWADLRLGLDDLRGASMLLEELTIRCPEAPQGWLLRAQLALGEEQYLEASNLLRPLIHLGLDEKSEEFLMYRELKRIATQGHLEALRAKKTKQGASSKMKKKGKR